MVLIFTHETHGFTFSALFYCIIISFINSFLLWCGLSCFQAFGSYEQHYFEQFCVCILANITTLNYLIAGSSLMCIFNLVRECQFLPSDCNTFLSYLLGKCFHGSTSLLIFIKSIVRLFNFKQSGEYVVISHGDFHLHSSDCVYRSFGFSSVKWLFK